MLDVDIPSSCILAVMSPNPMSIGKCVLEGTGSVWEVINSKENREAVWGCIPKKYQPKNTEPGIWG